MIEVCEEAPVIYQLVAEWLSSSVCEGEGVCEWPGEI